ncbi:MAG TPA: ankyrin repeat domain-containing protein [Gemmatimonadaceae bacterium]|nr:ankyrin repeat domain-containing protein [Gemmatimonadaceae bacterium]
MNDVQAFFSEIERGDVEVVRAMVAAAPRLVHARDATGATALHVAAFHGQRAIAELLLASGAEINARDDRFGATPAGWAIEYLRERGALLGVEIENALFAIQRGDVELVTRLVTRHPALASAVDRDGTPLAEHASAAADPEMAAVFARARTERD